MWPSYLNGLMLSASLIVAIGAQNAFVLGQSLRREYPLLVAGICVLCDALLITAGVLGLTRLITDSPLLLELLRAVGIAFLLLYGARALLRAVHPGALQRAGDEAGRSRRAVILATLAITLLNPHVYLDTVLLIGSLGARQASPLAFAAGATSASLLWFFALAVGAARLAPWLARPFTWRLIDLAVALMMAYVAVQLYLGG